MEGLRVQEIIVVVIMVSLVLGGSHTGRLFKGIWSLISKKMKINK